MKVPIAGILIGAVVVLFLLFLVIPIVIGLRSMKPAGAPSEAGIFKSADGGATWKEANRSADPLAGLPSEILVFEFFPEDPNTIYLGTKGGGLWVTKNGGESWARMLDAKGSLKPDAEIYAISIHAANPKIFYLAAYQENRGLIFRTVDGGITFDEMYRLPIERFGIFGVSVHPTNPNHVNIATGQGGFLESKDGGVSWRVMQWFPDGIIKLMQNPKESEELYFLTRRGEMYRTNNRGGNWVRLTDGYARFSGAIPIMDFEFDSANPAILYLASRFGLLRSGDRGITWTPVLLLVPPEALPVRSVSTDAGDSRKIYVSIGKDVYFSNDSGERWQVFSVPAAGNVNLLRASPSDGRTVYAVVGR